MVRRVVLFQSKIRHVRVSANVRCEKVGGKRSHSCFFPDPCFSPASIFLGFLVQLTRGLAGGPSLTPSPSRRAPQGDRRARGWRRCARRRGPRAGSWPPAPSPSLRCAEDPPPKKNKHPPQSPNFRGLFEGNSSDFVPPRFTWVPLPL